MGCTCTAGTMSSAMHGGDGALGRRDREVWWTSIGVWCSSTSAMSGNIQIMYVYSMALLVSWKPYRSKAPTGEYTLKTPRLPVVY